ncbi:MAG: hypothetical protein ACD_77C00182G0002 [uncultured bacterium]|nr:MAG: hypothetical protein ACD_77C00182G0002 [uncultured bacterium]
MMFSLNKIFLVYGHVVPQIVETKFIVCTECNIGLVRCLPGLRVWFVLVYTIYLQAVELIKRPHPLGVPFRKVVVHCDHMNSFTRKCIKKNREGCYKGFTFTSCHLCNFSLMQNNTSKKLNIIMDHIPYYPVTSCHPVVLPFSFIAFD